MGIGKDATCRDCGYQWVLNMGGGIAFEQLICDKCGQPVSQPRGAPANAPDRMSRAELRNYINDPGEWSTCGRSFVPSERALLAELQAFCGCGGRLRGGDGGKVTYRCPECKSARLKMGEVNVLFD